MSSTSSAAATVPAVEASGRVRRAWEDMRGGFSLWRLGVTLGWMDIKLRYRGSVLGPFWLTLSSLIMVASMGVIYARLFHMVLRDYLPFLSISLALWQIGLAGILQESCNCFIDASGTIRAVRLPFSVQAIRLLVRNAIVFAHNIVVPLGVFALYGVWPGMSGLLASIPGILLWGINGFAACLFLGAFCARFRDLPPIIGAVLQIAFYVTPIIWRPEQLGRRSAWLIYNPFYSLLEIVRGPLMGHIPSLDVALTAVGVSAVWVIVAVLTFIATRDKLAFWV
ncbi:ABC transporter permease [Kozakia baliensis]|uniref:ABC transporter permease n=1 Tax=Kozakia baliensis TaxID=153496 RepID=UPI0004978071|nr:ABC transporter permease [Kozakia baliensis]